MATQETLLHKPRKSIPKTFWLVLSLAAIISSSALVISHLNKPISIFHFSSAPNVCEHAVDTNSCLTHVAEVVQGSTLDNTKDHKLSTLISLLTKSTTHIRKAMDTANVIKRRINSPREENALNVCEKLMDLSMERVWDSVLTLTKDNMDSQQDAHTWLSSVLTNHATCFDGLEGTSRAVMENDIQDLISRARSSLAVLVAVLPPKDHDEFIDESLNGDFPSWVTSKDRRLLESSVGDVKANVVVAKDGSGKFKTVVEAVASAPNKGTARYVIYVKKGIYKENVEIASSKTNVMLVGDGMDATIITGSLNYDDGTGTFQTATVAAVGDGFIAQDIGFQNTAGPQKHQAVALRVGSDRSVINRCKIDAFQDTLYAHTNRQFYRDSFITGTIVHAWVNLSQSIKMEEILKDLVQKLHNVFGKPAPESIGTMNNDDLKKFIQNFLQRSQKYLIVLDDVWHVKVWDGLNHAFPNNNRGSRVMLTTRKRDIALYSCAGLGKDFHLEFLPEKEAWSLFCRKTFQDNSCPPHLEEVCRNILKLCGGLPLAIVAISGALATKERSNIEEWQIVCRSFGSEIEGNDKLEDMNKVISLSLNELPSYLKSCLMYLTIFPEFHAMETWRLIRLWIAEGFVNGEDGKTLEEVADSYLKELLDRSLIQVVEKTSDGRMKTCRMHGLLREIVNSKSRDQNFATIVKEQDMVWPERVRRLSVINPSHNVLQQNTTTFHLRSLLMFGLSDLLNQFSLHELCSSNGVQFLNVLDLQDAPLDDFPAEIVNLYLLKYLSLKNTKVKNIPGSIKRLQNLETLDLKHTSVTELPVEIAELKRLRHLLVYRYEIESYAKFHSRHGFKVAAPIGNMLSLQKLCFIEVDQGSAALMVELGKLTQLRRLGIRKMRKEDGAALCSSIEKMIHLRSLSIFAIEEDEVIDIHDISNPPRYLQQLYLSGRLEKFPQWINSCKNLARVFLKWSKLEEDPLVYLQGLPNLRHLELLQVYVGEMLHFNAKGFPSLKVLGLDYLEGLKYMTIEEGAMQGLKKLVMQRCSSFKNVPVGIEHLAKLKAIEFFDMPDELIMDLRPNGGKDFWRVQNVPTVYSTYWRNDGWDVYSLETFGDIESDVDHRIAMRTLQLPTLWKA